MRKFFYGFGQLLQYLCTWSGIGLLCLVLTWSLPAQAASRIDPQLEQQVLQIIKEHPEQIIESVQAYQQQQQQQLKQVRQAFLQDLKTNPQVVIGKSPTIGSAESKILLIEFSDYQCPYCAEAHKTLKELLAKHQSQIALVYKNFPLTTIHNEALPAATAAWAAKQQEKFWEYHDALFTNQKQLGEALYLDIAQNLNLDLVKFKRDRNLAGSAIEKDIKLAEKLGVTGTPFFIVNSPTVSGAIQLSDIATILANVK